MINVFNTLTAITECDCGCEDDLEIADVEEKLNNEYEELEEIEDDIDYTEEMVHLFSKTGKDGSTNYLVESDMLVKYMTSKNITSIKEAFEKIAEANNINVNTMVLLVESNEFVSNIITEAKESKGSKRCKKTLNDASSTAKFLKTVKTEGIKVAKKKSK